MRRIVAAAHGNLAETEARIKILRRAVARPYFQEDILRAEAPREARRFAKERHTYGLPFTARYSGWCPLCGRYIAKSRSKVVSVSPPIRPSDMDEDNSEFSYRHHTN